MPGSPGSGKRVPLMMPMLLLAVSILAYGLLIPRLGFAWDDLTVMWMRHHLGVQALDRVFAVSRPVMGWFYRLTNAILPPVPAYWLVFALFWRWAGAVVLWALIRSLWRGRGFLAAAVSLLFLIYPGFSQQFVSHTYSHYFAVLCFYLLSLLLMVWSIQYPRRRWLFTGLALLFSAANLSMLEYFFTLELLRPVILYLAWRSIPAQEHPSMKKMGLTLLPYLLVFVGIVIGRLFLFPNRLHAFIPLDAWVSAPGATLLSLATRIGKSLWLATVPAWSLAFHFPGEDAGYALWLQILVIAITSMLVVVTLVIRPADRDSGSTGRQVIQVLILGVIALLLAGWAFWLIQYAFSLEFPADRFTMPLMLGVSLLMAGLLEFIPIHWLKAGLLAALVGLGAGWQVVLAEKYAHEWDLQKSLFWQMTWRMPDIQPGTLVLLNDGAMDLYADNSLNATLNWIYTPEPTLGQVDYLLIHPRSRLGGSLPALAPDTPMHYDLIHAVFIGSTSQSLALDFNPPGCLRVLDPYLDPVNPSVQGLMQQAASFSNPGLILAAGEPHLPALYGDEPAHDWCYFFAKAGLAYQQADWQAVVALGDQAGELGMPPYFRSEWLIFIEAYGQTGDWGRALAVTTSLYNAVPWLAPALCRLWARLQAETPQSAAKGLVLKRLPEAVNCSP